MFSIQSAKEVVHYLEKQFIKPGKYQIYTIEDPQDQPKFSLTINSAEVSHDQKYLDAQNTSNCKTTREDDSKQNLCSEISSIQLKQQKTLQRQQKAICLDQSLQIDESQKGSREKQRAEEKGERVEQNKVEKAVQRLRDAFKKYIVERVRSSWIKEVYEKYKGSYGELETSRRQGEQSVVIDESGLLQEERLIGTENQNQNDDSV